MPHDVNYEKIHYIPAKGYEKPLVLSLYLAPVGRYVRIRFAIAGNGQCMFVLRDIMREVVPWTVNDHGGVKLGTKLRRAVCDLCGTPSIPKIAIFNDGSQATDMNAVNFETMAEIIRSYGLDRKEVNEMRRLLQDGTLVHNIMKVLPLGYNFTVSGSIAMRRIDCPLHRTVLLQRLAVPVLWDCKRILTTKGRAIQGERCRKGLMSDAVYAPILDSSRSNINPAPADYMRDGAYIESLELMAQSDVSTWRMKGEPIAKPTNAKVTGQNGEIIVTLTDRSKVTLRFGIKRERLHFALVDLTAAIYPFLNKSEAAEALLPWVRRVCDGKLPLVAAYGRRGYVEPMVPYSKLDTFLGQSRAPHAIELRKLASAGLLVARVHAQVPVSLCIELEAMQPTISVSQTVAEIEKLTTISRPKKAKPLPETKGFTSQKRAAYTKAKAPPSASDIWAQACAKYGLNNQEETK